MHGGHMILYIKWMYCYKNVQRQITHLSKSFSSQQYNPVAVAEYYLYLYKVK